MIRSSSRAAALASTKRRPAEVVRSVAVTTSTGSGSELDQRRVERRRLDQGLGVKQRQGNSPLRSGSLASPVVCQFGEPRPCAARRPAGTQQEPNRERHRLHRTGEKGIRRSSSAVMHDFEAQLSPAGVLMAGADIEAVRGGLAESNALLREIDHRVKNNLQLIASLIQLQLRRAEDPAARHALQTMLERLNAVTTVHRRLFQGDPHLFDAADFIRDLTPDLAAAAGRDDLAISLDLEPVVVPAASAAPLALVVGELIGNALKHAFPEGRTGQVSVSLRGRDGACVITVSDDGVGLNGRPPALGLTIVRLLCQQLHASLDFAEAGPAASRVTVRAPARIA